MKVVLSTFAAATTAASTTSTASAAKSATAALSRADKLAQQRNDLTRKKAHDAARVMIQNGQFDADMNAFRPDTRPAFSGDLQHVQEVETSSGGTASFIQSQKKRAYLTKGQIIEHSAGKFLYIGCFLDDSSRMMLNQKSLSSSSSAMEQAFTHCQSKNKPYFSIQYSTDAFCSGNPAEDGGSKKPATTYAFKTEKSINDCNMAAYKESFQGGGGGGWRNSIFMEVGPSECPTGYTTIFPADTTKYMDMPQSDDTGVTSVVDVGTSVGCSNECNKDDACVAMATDGKKCFLYDDAPAPAMNPANFITCNKIPPIITKVEKLAATVTSMAAYVMDNDGGIADKTGLEDLIADTKIAAIDALADSLR